MYLGLSGTIGGERVGMHEHGRYWELRQKGEGFHVKRRRQSKESVIMPLFDCGHDVEEICAKTGYGRDTVVNCLRRNGVRWGKPGPKCAAK